MCSAIVCSNNSACGQCTHSKGVGIDRQLLAMVAIAIAIVIIARIQLLSSAIHLTYSIILSSFLREKPVSCDYIGL